MLKYKRLSKIKKPPDKTTFYYFQFYDYCMKEYLLKNYFCLKLTFKNKSKMIRKPKSKKLITFIGIQKVVANIMKKRNK